MKNSFLLFALCLPWQMTAAGASAQDPAKAAVGVPILGYAYDSGAHRIHPVQGIPGAALIAVPVLLPPDTAAVAISNARDYVFVAGETVSVLDLASGARISIAGVPAGPARVVISPDGAAAALYYAANNLIAIVTGLPATPVVARTIVTAGLAGQPSVLSVSDSGQSLAVVLEDGSRAFLAVDDGFLALPAPGPVAALAFRPGTEDLAAATTDGQIWSTKQENGQTRYSLVGGGTGKPAAAAFSGDGSRVFAVYADGTIAVFDFTGGAPAALSCGCSPQAFRPAKGSSLFLLEDSGGRLRLFDGSGSTPRLLFIPAAVEENLQ